MSALLSTSQAAAVVVVCSNGEPDSGAPPPWHLQGFLLAYLLTAAVLAAAVYTWRSGADIVVVGLGWPHVILGFVLYARKLGKASGPALWHFAIVLGATALIGVVHTLRPITTLIYLYFVVHAFRDEMTMYHQRRTGHRFRGSMFDARGRALLGGMVLLAAAAQYQQHANLDALVAGVDILELSLLSLSLMAALGAVTGIPAAGLRRFPGLRYVLPALFLGIVAMTLMRVLRLNGLPAPLFFSFLVVFHYFSWYVFHLEKIAARARAVDHDYANGGERWLSALTTRPGFLRTVLLMNLASFAGAWIYQTTGAAWMSYAFDVRFFLYVLVFHVTVSFAPREPRRATASRW
jgi:hypothetical protein